MKKISRRVLFAPQIYILIHMADVDIRTHYQLNMKKIGEDGI